MIFLLYCKVLFWKISRIMKLRWPLLKAYKSDHNIISLYSINFSTTLWSNVSFWLLTMTKRTSYTLHMWSVINLRCFVWSNKTDLTFLPFIEGQSSYSMCSTITRMYRLINPKLILIRSHDSEMTSMVFIIGIASRL